MMPAEHVYAGRGVRYYNNWYPDYGQEPGQLLYL